MSNGTFGSITNPSFAGWIEHGAGWQFACKFQSPAFDIYVIAMHGYFDTYQGSGAIGKMCIWQDGGGYPILALLPGGIINNGTLAAGGQQWWGQNLTTPLFLKANSLVWLGMWCNQNIVVSTYDTNPQTWAMLANTSNPVAFSGAGNSGQGPLGVYAEYSTVVYSGVSTMGGAGDLVATGSGHIPATLANLGNAGGGLASVNSQNRGNLTSLMGGGGGLFIPAEVVKSTLIKIWRP